MREKREKLICMIKCSTLYLFPLDLFNLMRDLVKNEMKRKVKERKMEGGKERKILYDEQHHLFREEKEKKEVEWKKLEGKKVGRGRESSSIIKSSKFLSQAKIFFFPPYSSLSSSSFSLSSFFLFHQKILSF